MTLLRLCSLSLATSAALLAGCSNNNGSNTPLTPYAINGTLFGMATGTSLILANTVNGDTLDLNRNGSFQFAETVFDNDAYTITVATHPFNQTCTVSNGNGTVDEDNVTGINVHCAAAQFRVGGSVSGLAGTLTLQNSNGPDLNLTANGTFNFPATVTAGSAYRVAVQNQPANQTCTVSNGSGTASGSNVTNIAITCVNNTAPRTIGGSVTGLAGTMVVQNNFGNNTSLTSDGAFTFSSPLNTGSAYAVSVLTQPFGQTCSVTNASGTANADVTNVDIQCAAATYAVGGSIIGLGGIPGESSILTLSNNGEQITRLLNGNFSFPTPVAHNGSYNVAVEEPQPFGQLCSVTAGSGTVTGAAVTSVEVSCAPRQYTFGYSVSGLGGDELRLINNGVTHTVTQANANDFFPVGVYHGESYNLRINRQPAGQTCVVQNGSGVAEAAVVVNILCSFQVTIRGTNPRTLNFEWPAQDGATHYRVLKDPDGDGPAPPFQVGTDTAATSLAIALPVHAQDWVNARYRVQRCVASDCTAIQSVWLSALDAAANAIGYFKASNTDVDDRFGSTLALSADGSTLAVGAPGESSNGRGIDPAGTQGDNSASQSGAVYVFARDGATWAQQAFIKASNADAQDGFGGAVTLSADGSTLAVGAPGESSGSPTDMSDNDLTSAGAVYVYERTAGVWTEQAYIKASSPLEFSFFGGNLYQSLFGVTIPGSPLALSADGTTLVVGASGQAVPTPDPGDEDPSNEGAAYVFTRSGAGAAWSQDAIIKPVRVDSGDIFGHSVAVSDNGSLIAVGAPLEDGAGRGINVDATNDSAESAGAAYVYLRTPGGWSETYLKPSNAQANQRFGHMVALAGNGDTLVVSAIDESSNAVGAPEDTSQPSSGALYVFERSSGLWSEKQRLKASHIVQGQQLGMTLAISSDGSLIAAGATGDDSAGRGVTADPANSDATNSGAVITFRLDAGTWQQAAYLKAPNSDAGDAFGSAVSLSTDGAILAVGSPSEDSAVSGVNGGGPDGAGRVDNSTVQSGAAFLY
jgi:hypothetical protein